METRLFKAESYMQPGESYHFARKALADGPPDYLHRHDFYELCLIEEGSALHLCNGETARLETGHLLFIRPDDAHALSAVGPKGCRIINVLFHTETAVHMVARYADDLDRRFFWTGATQPFSVRLNGPRMERAVNTALELVTTRRSLLRLEDFLLTVMNRVVDYAALDTSAMPGWLASACQAARQSGVYQQGAAGFVAAAGRGHEHVCRMAKLHLGVSPSVYVNRIRMEHAAMSLGGSDVPIADVARDVGIENLSHFYKLFKTHYGVTPKAYRARHLRNPVPSKLVS